MAFVFAPDPILLEIIGQGQGNPCRVRLTLPDGSSESGTLASDALLPQAAALSGDDDPAALGRCLYTALFPAALDASFRGALRASGTRGVRLTLEIDPDLPALHRLCWEQMALPQPGGDVLLSSAPNVFFSRRLRTARGWASPLAAGALRILLVISSPYPPGTLFVDVAQEQAQIEAVWRQFDGQVRWDVLSGQVSAQQIAGQLDQAGGYDVLHYIGHGDWNEAEQTGYLMLTETYPDGSTGPMGVTAAQLLQRITTAQRLPQLIVLAACQSGQQSSNDAFAGIGPALVRAGCPALVCMQEKVEMAVARRFGEVFYATLLETGTLDWAVNRARAALLENHYQQWAVPALYMHLLDGVLFNPEQRFQPAQRTPYKFLAPYTRDDQDIFMGRQAKVDETVRRVRESALTIVIGDEGIGLTSLMEAGVRPRLEADGWWVVRLAEYADIASEFRVQMRVNGRAVTLQISGDAPLADALRAAGAAGFSHLALVLDQFERALALPEAEQAQIARALAEGIAALGARLHLVLVAHKSAAGALAGFQTDLGRSADAWVDVPPLAQADAVEAMLNPLKVLQFPVVLDADLARNHIAPDLCSLYGDEDGSTGLVDPGQLQITCTWLFNKARQSPQPLINSALYLESGGSEGILVSYMKEELKTRFAGEMDRAQNLLVRMAAPDMDHWVAPEQIAAGDELAAVSALLDRMAKAELLVRKLRDGRYVYAFASAQIRAEAQRLDTGASARAYNVREELERAWRLWLAEAVTPGSDADRALPSRAQLLALEEHAAELSPRAVKTLMLLRAAVLRDTSPAPWLKLLADKETDSDLVTALELPGHEAAPSAAVEMARRLTGLDQAAVAGEQNGALAWAAVNAQDVVDRGTAALALSVLPDGAGLPRLQTALAGAPSGVRRWLRAGEIGGRLADAGVPFAAGVPGQRSSAWLWRVGRRIVRARGWITWAALGGGIGAGLLLGLERMLVGLLAQQAPAAVLFALYSYWGLLLAGVTGAAIALAAPLRLRNAPAAARSDGLAVLALGTLGFGLANLLVALLNGFSLSRAPLVIPLGFAAGLAYAAAAVLVPAKGWARLALLAAGFGLALAGIQALFNTFPQIGAGISISLSSGFFEVEFDHFQSPAWQNWISAFEGWARLLSVIEAFFAGLALAFGGLAGMRIAAAWRARWQRFLDRGAGM